MNCRGGHLVIKIKTQHQCFVIWGWERMGTEKPNPWLNIVSCSSWIFLWFLAMEAFRCGKVFHWIFSAALPNARHTVRFLTQECYFNRHCTKKRVLFMFQSMHMFTCLSCAAPSCSPPGFPFPAGAVRGMVLFFPASGPSTLQATPGKKAPSPSLLLTASIYFPKHGAWCPLPSDSTA